MLWQEIREAYPNRWLIIEALESHTQNNQRILDSIAVIETCPNGAIAMQRYQDWRRQYPQREFYFIHTQRESLDIVERRWAGIRSG